MGTKLEKGKKIVTLELDVEIEDVQESEDEDVTCNNYEKENITSKLYLKPIDPTKKASREAILRRIRHRKRVNKVKSAVETLFSSPFSTSVDTSLKKVTVQPPQKWVDDAFAAP